MPGAAHGQQAHDVTSPETAPNGAAGRASTGINLTPGAVPAATRVVEERASST